MSFKKFSGGNTPGQSQREGATPFRTQHPAQPLTGHGGTSTLELGPKAWSLNVSAVVVPLPDGIEAYSLGPYLPSVL